MSKKNLKLPFLTEPNKEHSTVQIGNGKKTGVLEVPKYGDLSGLEYDWLEETRKQYGIKNNNVLLAEFVDGVAKKYDIPLKEVWQSVNKIEQAALKATEESEESWIDIFQDELNCPLQDYIEYSQKIKTYYRQEKYLRATLVLRRVDSNFEVEDVKDANNINLGLIDCLARFCTEEMNAIATEDQTPEPITEQQIKNSPSSAESPNEKNELTGAKSIGASKNTGVEKTNGSITKTLVSSHSG
ncbi:MAG: hypothetical protein QNJ54_16235 [Prochloraceae cyanobacterium]|nr:hypothetical protein [Prochloraceae cyanobacterium]